MGQSSRLRLHEIRGVFELVYECCERGADPVAWRQHLLHGVNRLVGGSVAFGGRADWGEWFQGGATRSQVLRVFGDVGFPNEAERRVYLEWLDGGSPLENPITQAIVERGITKTVVTRRQVVSDRDWNRSPLMDRLRRDAQLDEAMCSVELLAPGRFLLLAVHRPRKERGFGERERRLLALLHDETRLHLGGRLASFGDPGLSELAPRLRQVLACLLEGDSEKQVAQRLHLSRETVHTHVKRLHRHFGVHSRGELLARCYRYLPLLHSEDR